ncbi:MAG: hypothetical protein FVQ80_06840 [Planctomycetes bacterium]|nr:hypothetical protein [Planctomycetota bacterium]
MKKYLFITLGVLVFIELTLFDPFFFLYLIFACVGLALLMQLWIEITDAWAGYLPGGSKYDKKEFDKLFVGRK